MGGVGLAQGYWNRPELTAERFIPDPFSGEGGSRLYRTGDLVRYREDGNVEFLGRIDHQVKVRGFRIELGEIEAVMRSHPAVCETVVVSRHVSPGDERLVAYATLIDGIEPPSGQDLRNHLRTLLPGYMVPASVLVLDDLPVTPAGKIDRRRLPLPDGSAADSAAFVEPVTELERQVADLFGELLGIDRVGMHDDFFDLGGHSLLATKLVSQVRERFRVELPLRYFFETPTVSGLCDRIAAADSTSREDLSKIADTLSTLDSLSGDEIKAALKKRKASRGSDLGSA